MGWQNLPARREEPGGETWDRLCRGRDCPRFTVRRPCGRPCRRCGLAGGAPGSADLRRIAAAEAEAASREGGHVG